MRRELEVRAEWHHFDVTDVAVPITSRVPARGTEHTGLVRRYPTGLEIITGVVAGPVNVTVVTSDSAPPEPDHGDWQDVCSVSVRVLAGPLVLSGPLDSPSPSSARLDLHGPGDYRIRIHARGRDTSYDLAVEAPCEDYLVEVWPEPRSDTTPLRATSTTSARWSAQDDADLPPLGGVRYVNDPIPWRPRPR
ncbi:hypothetical protein [Cellulomonas hominis]